MGCDVKDDLCYLSYQIIFNNFVCYNQDFDILCECVDDKVVGGYQGII